MSEQNGYHLVGSSPALERVRDAMSQVAPIDLPVLITGESGTGKEVVARTIHQLSGRKGEFVDMNCAAVPEGLFESELFGHEKGAFTGAHGSREGLFEMAAEGTIFLDEIGDTPFDIQTKLLRVLNDKTFRRVGGRDRKPLTTTARVIAATNQDLEVLIRERRFRADLYYRLCVFPIVMPPLRERREDIVVIADHLLAHEIRPLLREGRPRTLTKEAAECLRGYDWAGNARELYNVLVRAAISSPGSPAIDAPALCGVYTRFVQAKTEEPTLEEVERRHIEHVLRTYPTSTGEETAEILGIARKTLYDKIRQHNLEGVAGRRFRPSKDSLV